MKPKVDSFKKVNKNFKLLGRLIKKKKERKEITKQIISVKN